MVIMTGPPLLSVLDATEIAGDGDHIHPYILCVYSGEEDGKYTVGPCGRRGDSRHSGQPELLDRDYEEHCASHLSDKRSDQFDENAQIGVTVQAVK
jgi:hypothetical protein